MGIEPTTSGLDLPLLSRQSYEVVPDLICPTSLQKIIFGIFFYTVIYIHFSWNWYLQADRGNICRKVQKQIISQMFSNFHFLWFLAMICW